MDSKPVASTTTSASWRVPAVSVSPVSSREPTTLGDQLDVVAAQHAVPPVVEQHPLAEGRVVGDGLLDQVGAVTELLGQVAR